MGYEARRRASMAAVFAATALVLAACGGESTPETPAAATSAAASAPASEFPTTGTGEVHLYNWTDYINPDELTRFEEETGIKVVLDTFDSNETMLAKIQSGATGYDVLVPSDYMVAQMIELGLLENIGVNSFPNAVHLKDNMLGVYWDANRDYSAPYMYGTTGIGCNADKEDCSKITSWADYFASDSASIDSLNDQTEVVSAALRAAGVPAADLCTTDKAQYAKAQEILAGFKPSVINSDGGIERVVAGTSTIRHAWNGSVHRMKAEIPAVEYIYPSEGLNLWADNFVVPVGAPNLENAKIFINWMMDPKNIAMESNFSGYDNGIKGSDEFMDESLKTDPAVVVPADKVALMTPTPNCGQEARDLYTEVFTSWTTSQ
jgi:spermidine/putrescine transport system substrate-binding protein